MKKSEPTKKQVKFAKYLKLLPGLFLAISCMVGNAQTFNWAKSMGGSTSDQSYAVATDGSGNVYMTGYFSSDTAYFNPGGSGGILINPGPVDNDVFLAKYDAEGNYLWAKNWGGSKSEYGQGVATDDSGNVYVIGEFSSDTADFNPGGSGGVLINTTGTAGYFDVFLAKYDSAGNYLWAKNWGGNFTDRGYGIAVDGSGNVYVTGDFNSYTIDFNPGGSGGLLTNTMTTGTFRSNTTDAFLAKYDAGGNFLWAKSTHGMSHENGYGVAVDDNGNVYMTGKFHSDTADFNPGGSGGKLINTKASLSDAFLAKYDAGGNFLWVKGMGGMDGDQGQGVAVDSKDNVYVTGEFRSPTIDFNPGGSGGILTTLGNFDVFLAKYDAGGNFLWAKSMGSNWIDYGQGVAVDGGDNVYVTGSFRIQNNQQSFHLGGSGDTLASAGSDDVFLAKYDAGGNYLWAKSMGGSSEEHAYGVAVDRGGSVYLTGTFISDTADFNRDGSGGKLVNPQAFTAWEMYLVKFGCGDTSLSHLTVSLPCGESYTLNENVYTASGIYTQVFSNTRGCDSTITLELTVDTITKPMINIDSFTLGVTDTYATYQWIKDGALIPGATDSTYTVMANGNYQVIVANGHSCSDTSDVYLVTNYTGITDDVQLLSKYIKVYPNPANNVVHIQSPVSVDATLTDVAGRTIRKIKDAHSLSVKDLDAGIYLLQVMDQKERLIKVEKVVKQKQ